MAIPWFTPLNVSNCHPSKVARKKLKKVSVQIYHLGSRFRLAVGLVASLRGFDKRLGAAGFKSPPRLARRSRRSRRNWPGNLLEAYLLVANLCVFLSLSSAQTGGLTLSSPRLQRVRPDWGANKSDPPCFLGKTPLLRGCRYSLIASVRLHPKCLMKVEVGKIQILGSQNKHWVSGIFPSFLPQLEGQSLLSSYTLLRLLGRRTCPATIWKYGDRLRCPKPRKMHDDLGVSGRVDGAACRRISVAILLDLKMVQTRRNSADQVIVIAFSGLFGVL